MTTIALFGTSADPPTAGHQAILTWLAQRFDRVAVWAADNPFKPQQTPLAHRVAMLKLLIAEICEMHQQARSAVGTIGYDAELSNPRSLLTVQQARQQWPDGQFSLVIGSDLIRQLPDWYHIDELLTQVNLLIIPRPDYPITPTALTQLQNLNAHWSVADITGLPVSSTTYRQAREASVITPAIAQYISEQGLYGGGGG